MTTFIRAQIDHSVESDPQPQIEPFDLIAGESGLIRVHGADLVMVGEMSRGDNRQACIMVGHSGCRCGCGAKGRAFSYLPTSDEMRELGRRMLAVADELDADAAQLAQAALKKAAGK